MLDSEKEELWRASFLYKKDQISNALAVQLNAYVVMYKLIT